MNAVYLRAIHTYIHANYMSVCVCVTILFKVWKSPMLYTEGSRTWQVAGLVHKNMNIICACVALFTWAESFLCRPPMEINTFLTTVWGHITMNYGRYSSNLAWSWHSSLFMYIFQWEWVWVWVWVGMFVHLPASSNRILSGLMSLWITRCVCRYSKALPSSHTNKATLFSENSTCRPKEIGLILNVFLYCRWIITIILTI